MKKSCLIRRIRQPGSKIQSFTTRLVPGFVVFVHFGWGSGQSAGNTLFDSPAPGVCEFLHPKKPVFQLLYRLRENSPGLGLVDHLV